MREFIKSCVDSYSERIKNPLIGAFSISFILYNWRPVFILLFSDFAMEEKISIIDTYYCSYQALFWPIIITLIYVLIIPYFNLIIDRILGLSKSEKYKLKNRVIDENMTIRKKQAKNEREIADLRAGTSQINELKSKIDQLTGDNTLKSEMISDIVENNKKEIQIMKDLNSKLSKSLDETNESYKNFILENKDNNEVLELLTSFSTANISNIKKYLRNNLGNKEISALKKSSKNALFSLDFEHFTQANISLLMKADICQVNSNTGYFNVIDNDFVSSL